MTVGPLTWPKLRGLADADQAGYGDRSSDGWHYRFSAHVLTGAEVTATVGAQVRAQVGLEYGSRLNPAPAPAVAFHGCPETATDFPGGFFVAGDGRACVPLEVRVDDGAPHLVVISFFNGPCPA